MSTIMTILDQDVLNVQSEIPLFNAIKIYFENNNKDNENTECKGNSVVNSEYSIPLFPVICLELSVFLN